MAVISVCGSYFDDRIFLKWKRISISFLKWLIKSSIHLMWIDYICIKIILTKGQYVGMLIHSTLFTLSNTIVVFTSNTKHK